MATISVTNGTISPCIKGVPDGCWKSTVSAKPGDQVGIQIYFDNTGDDSVANVSLGYRLEYANSNKTVICRGGISAGNIIACTGIAHIFSKEPIKLIYHPEATKFFRTGESNGEKIAANTSFGESRFDIGTIPNGQNSQGFLIVQFIVEKAD
jgi:hypothetical protein